jgi:hypothetical protein
MELAAPFGLRHGNTHPDFRLNIPAARLTIL